MEGHSFSTGNPLPFLWLMRFRVNAETSRKGKATQIRYCRHYQELAVNLSHTRLVMRSMTARARVEFTLIVAKTYGRIQKPGESPTVATKFTQITHPNAVKEFGTGTSDEASQSSCSKLDRISDKKAHLTDACDDAEIAVGECLRTDFANSLQC